MDLNNRISNTNGRDERARALGRVYQYLLSLPMEKKDTDAGSHFDEDEPTPVGDAPSSNELEQDDDNTPAVARTNSGDLNFNGVNDA
jgi:hypothetical protein